MGSKLEFDLF